MKVILAALLTASSFSLFADGVLEINQVCALNGGCFAGDSAGFPVTIDGSAGKSYRLTGDLDLSSFPDTTAIELDGPFISLDLNGFEIAGPITCTGSGSTLNCGAVGSGDGISLSGNADFVTIRNGTIRNMSRHGVGASGNELRIIDVTASHNARDGLNGGSNSIATNCIAHENGNDGFQFGSGSVIEQSAAFGNGEDGIRIESSNGVINNSTARNNGLQGFEMGHSSRFGKNSSTGNGATDTCGGGLCTEKRRFYVSQTPLLGNQVLDACEDGFHMASWLELLDVSNNIYDYILGGTADDSGTGPPTTLSGWIRSGYDSNDGTITNKPRNCNTWGSSLGSDFGMKLRIDQEWPIIDQDGAIYPVRINESSCDTFSRVWCIED